MAIVREHLAAKGLGLHNDLQNESSIVGNFPVVHMMLAFGTPEQQAEFLPGLITGTHQLGFGLTEPNHGSDATWLETTAVRDGGDWVINGTKRFNSGLHTRHARHDLRAHRGQARRRRGHHLLHRADDHARASTSTSCGGRSTCRPTTPR